MKRPQILFRVRLLSVVIVLIAVLLVARLYQIQVIKSEYYQAKAESQYVHTKSDLYSRGSILFTSRDGSTLSAAAIQSGYILAANTGQITNSIPEFCNTLSKYLDDGLKMCPKSFYTRTNLH